MLSTAFHNWLVLRRPSWITDKEDYFCLGSLAFGDDNYSVTRGGGGVWATLGDMYGGVIVFKLTP